MKLSDEILNVEKQYNQASPINQSEYVKQYFRPSNIQLVDRNSTCDS